MDDINDIFLEACHIGDLDKAKDCLTNKDLERQAFIDTKDKNGWTGLMIAAFRGDVEMMKYFLTSDELNIHANIEEAIPELYFNAFMIACYYNKEDIISYLIMDYNLQIDDKTRVWLILGNDTYNPEYSKVLNMIDARDINNHLQETLVSKTQNKLKKI